MAPQSDKGLTMENLRGASATASCHTCRHRKLGTLGCDAFGVIPVEIMRGDVKHTAPYAGDRGIQYEAGTPKPVSA